VQIARQRSQKIGLNLPDSPGNLSLSELWGWHQVGQSLYRQGVQQDGSVSWLQLKQELAWRSLESCRFCVHDCQVNRLNDATGYCRLKTKSPVSGSYLHFGEERPISPTWAVFFSGCTMHCSYCHNWRETFDFSQSMEFDAASLIQDLRKHQGEYRSLSFIGGTPEPHLHTIIDFVLALPSELVVPLVFNNNATLSHEGLALMEGVVDIYLPDFKHGNDQCAWKLTRIQNYLGSLCLNLDAYLAQRTAILVRHLVLPGHLNCCTRPVLELLADRYPGIAINIMFQYRPMYKAEDLPMINRSLSAEEEARVQAWMHELGLKSVA